VAEEATNSMRRQEAGGGRCGGRVAAGGLRVCGEGFVAEKTDRVWRRGQTRWEAGNGRRVTAEKKGRKIETEMKKMHHLGRRFD